MRAVTDAELERVALFRASLRRFLRQTEVVARSYGLTPRRYDLLLFVHASPGHRTTTAELTKRLRLGQPAVTELVNRAERAELLRRTRDSLDRRRVHIELTPEGRELLAKIVLSLRDARGELADSIRETQRRLREIG